ncbi:MAG: 2-C-methyl-D-erythritol 4-phosphate cytidylyltransferase [Gemmataceae bacterium]
MTEFAVILPAAGRSTRFGGLQKRPFVRLQGKAIWQRSAELFWNRPDVSKVYIVLSLEDVDDFKTQFGPALLFANAELVPGGSERFESVANALSRIPDSVPFVAIHDAVRPLVTPKAIDAVFAAAKSTGAAMLGRAVADTLKRIDPAANRITETVPRENLWAAQTPQVFRRDWLMAAYANRAAFSGAITDDSQLIEAAGHTVRMVPGPATNFKITSQEDFRIAEALLGQVSVKGDDRKTAPPRFGEEPEW